MSFASLYSHGFVRVAAAVPHMRIGEPAFNAERTLALARRASERHAALVIFPELGISGYSIDDLLHQAALLDAVASALERIVAASASIWRRSMVVGAPLRVRARGVQHRGRDPSGPGARGRPQELPARVPRVLREAPVPGRPRRGRRPDRVARLRGRAVRAGSAVRRRRPGRVRPARRDLRGPVGADPAEHVRRRSPARRCSRTCRPATSRSARLAFAASCASRSRRRTIAGYLYTAAGMGESTTDLAWDGQALIYENGDRLAEAERFAIDEQLILADLDLDRIVSDRASTSSYGDSIHDHRRRLARMRRVELRARARRSRRSVASPGRAVPVRARRSGQPQRALRGGLQHPGARARDPAARDRDREDRDRRLRRARLDTRADRRRPRDRPPRAPAGARARVHDAGLRDQRAHAAATPTG